MTTLPVRFALPEIVSFTQRFVESNSNVLVHTRPGHGTWTAIRNALVETGRPVLDLRLYTVDDSPEGFPMEQDSNAILLVSEFWGTHIGIQTFYNFILNKPKGVAVVGVSLTNRDIPPALYNRFIHLFRD